MPAQPTPSAFARRSLAVSAIWLLCIYPLLNFFVWDHLPSRAKSLGADFSQYYSAALAVRTNMRECLYPKPDALLYSSPPTFRPEIATPFFKPEENSARTGKWSYYPQVSEPGASTVSEKLDAQCKELQGNSHYISPPPLALLLAPLSLLDYTTSCRAIWFTLMCWSLFGISYYSSGICRIIYPHRTYVEGITALLPAVPTWLVSGLGTSLYIGNVSPLIGFLVTFAAYGFLTNKQSFIALATIPLVLLKGIGLMWCPLLLTRGIKWKALVIMAFLTLVLNSLAIHLGGIETYQTFFGEMLPKGNIPSGIGIQGMLMKLLGVEMGLIPMVLRVALALAIYYYHYKSLARGRDCGLVSLVSVIATMALFNLLNTIVWPHYFTCYLILPFAPWIIRELSLLQGKTRKILSILILTTPTCWLDSIFLVKDSLLAVTLKNANLYLPVIDFLRKIISITSFYVIPNVVTLIILILAIRRLVIWSSPDPATRARPLSST